MDFLTYMDQFDLFPLKKKTHNAWDFTLSSAMKYQTSNNMISGKLVVHDFPTIHENFGEIVM